MAFNEEGMVMPVSPMYGNNGFGMDGGWWLIILFVLLFGNNGWGGNNGNVQRGFDQQAVMGELNGLQNGIANLGTQICNGFAGVEQGANARQIANMQTAFAAQTAMTGGFNNLAAELANCCCENRLGTADLKYTVATENCADRAALSDGIRDIIANQTASVQRILDQLCQDKIDAKNDTIAQLRQELLYARGQASQDVQTARILAGQTSEVDALYDRLNNCPVGTVPVYGRTPIFNCNNSGTGCGCGTF